MLRRFLLTIILFITLLLQSLGQGAMAQEDFKVTSVNFDASNEIIFLTSPDTMESQPIAKKIKLNMLSAPKRAYFDIDSAILTMPAQNWELDPGSNYSGIKQIKVAQFETNPNQIRVVLYLDDNFDSQNINFLRVNNNIIIQLSDKMCDKEYFQPIYSDETISSSDFYENLKVVEDSQNLPTASKTEMISEIQNAFDALDKNIERKDFKLRSKYYLAGIYPKDGNVLVSGFGALSIEKPLYLTNPSRVVFDIPDAVVNPDFRNKEFKLSDTELIKVGQFERSKARIVIYSEQTEKFIPIFSSDNQSLLIANSDKVDTGSLFGKTADAISYYARSVDPVTGEFIMAFNYPVVHGIERDSNSLIVYLFNVFRYNESVFKDVIKSTNIKDLKIELMPKVGMKLILPLDKNGLVSTYLGADAKALKIVAKGTKRTLFFGPKAPPATGSRVMIDAGHGGSDYGAIRSGVNEKDINLDIAKRVEAILLSKGVAVDMVRRGDDTVSLQERTAACEKCHPDIFVSVHVNSSVKPEIAGIETHYYHTQSLDLARIVHASMINAVNAPDRGLFKSKFYVINHTEVPAILVEVGFMSNQKELSQLTNERRKQATAKAIADGIVQYLNNR